MLETKRGGGGAQSAFVVLADKGTKGVGRWKWLSKYKGKLWADLDKKNAKSQSHNPDEEETFLPAIKAQSEPKPPSSSKNSVNIKALIDGVRDVSGTSSLDRPAWLSKPVHMMLQT